MNWLFLVLIAVFSGSSHIYIDNYISDFYFKGRGAVAQKMFFTTTLSILQSTRARRFNQPRNFYSNRTDPIFNLWLVATRRFDFIFAARGFCDNYGGALLNHCDNRKTQPKS